MALWLMTALLVKHFVMDFPLQAKYMLEQKGIYLANGGVHHAFLHGIATALIFHCFGFTAVASSLGILDILIHYHLDYFKVKLGKHFNWAPDKRVFWTALGVDQLGHQLTYVFLIALALASQAG